MESNRLAHQWIKIIISLPIGMLLWSFGVSPVLSNIDRPPLYPSTSENLISLGFGDLPDTGSVDISLTTQPPNSSMATKVSISAYADEYNELKAPFLVVFAGPISSHVRDCSGSAVSLKSGIEFGQLSQISESRRNLAL